jgi:hypothetical protein
LTGAIAFNVAMETILPPERVVEMSISVPEIEQLFAL